MAMKARRAAPSAAPRTVAARPAPTLIAPPLRLNGSLDRVHPEGVVEGWCWSQDEPHLARRVAVLLDGVEAVRLVADQPRADLVAAGIGAGRHAFRCVLPAAMLRQGETVTVSLRDIGTGQSVGLPARVRWGAAPAAAEAAQGLTGSIDRVSRDGWVSGWCWYPDRPGAHVELAVLIDDEPAGFVTADAFRPDLQEAGIGDGTHGFAYALPYEMLAERGLLRVTVQERATGRRLGEPVVMRLGRVAAAEERIEELEREIRLLRGELKTLRREASVAEEDRATRELFATVAAFFHDLAEGERNPVGRALGGADPGQTITSLAARCPPFALAVPEAPRATICLSAAAPCQTVHACLAALHAARLDEACDVVVLDDGAKGPDLALLPALVRNLRYVFLHGRGGLVAARNEVAAEARGRLLICLAPEARPAPDWLAEIEATFASEPGAALVAGRLERPDGLLQHAGLFAGSDGTLHDPGHLATLDAPGFGFMRPVDAAAGYACAIDREALREMGGFSPLFARFGHALADLCARLRAAGRSVLYQPLARAAWQPGAEEADGAPPDLRLNDEETLRLRERLHAGWPAPVRFIGHALVVDDDLPRADRDAGSVLTFEQMRTLRRLGWRVTFAAAQGAAADPAACAALARHGIERIGAPRYRAVTDYLQEEGERLDLVQIYRHANAALLQERVRHLAPRAKLIFAPADLHHLRESRRAAVLGGANRTTEREAELACVRAADATLVHSDFEQAALAEEVEPARVALVRWIARPVPPARGFAERRHICFVGNFRHRPNSDGVLWFVAEVLPRVRSYLPGLRLLLAGSDMPPQIAALASDSVEVLGWVPDLRALFEQVRLSVAPLRFGAGFKGKVATSLAHGLPVVGSSVSLEGTGLAPGEGVAIADEPESFARAIVRLHEDASLWQAQSARGLERVAALYSPEAAMEAWRALLGRLGLPAVR